MHEQAGHRPALVLSPATYNAKTGLLLCCPMTTQVKGDPFEVVLAGREVAVGFADQVNCLDWVVRGTKRKGKVTASKLSEVRSKLQALVGSPV